MYGEIGSSPLFASGDSLTLVWIEGEPLKSLRPPILDAKERHHTWKQCRQVTIIIHTYRVYPQDIGKRCSVQRKLKMPQLSTLGSMANVLQSMSKL